MKHKIRPMGDIITDLEHLLDEMYLDHDMQHGDVLGQIWSFSESHYPDNKAVYEDGTPVVYFYGPVDKKPGKG